MPRSEVLAVCRQGLWRSLVLAGWAFGIGLSASAQSDPAAAGAPLADPEAPTTRPTATSRPLWELGIGVAGLSVPAYRGADQSRSYLLPLPYAIYRGQWLRADRDGARAVLIDAPRLDVDISVGATVPVRSRDNNARSGMPDLPATLEIGPNVNVRLLTSSDRLVRLDLRLPLRTAITLERSPEAVGATFSPNLNLDIGGRAGGLLGGWNLGLLTGPLFGDRKYHAFLYDVDPAYATPERPAYRARGGYEGWRALAATSRRFDSAWFGAFVRYDSLAGAAFEDSPLVRRKSGVSVGFGVAWVLGTSSEQVQVRD